MNVLAPLSPPEEAAVHGITQNALVGIIGSKGGAGATTLAVNLSATLARLLPNQNPVSLLDANFQQPDAALQLDCRPEHSLTELLIRSHTLEPQMIDACKHVVNSCQNLRLITAAIDGSAATRHDKGELLACLPLITASSSVTVMDLPRTLDKSLVMLLDLCQVIILVVEPNISSIAATRRWLEAFHDLEYPAGKIILAANRLGSKAKLLETQLSSSFSLYPLLKIPNAFKSIEASQIEGIPSVCRNPRDPYAKSILALCQETLLRLKVEAAQEKYQSQTVRAKGEVR